MKYYTVFNDELFIADKKETLEKFYNSYILELPADYENRKYLIGDIEIEIDVPDYKTIEEPIYKTADVLDNDGNVIDTELTDEIDHYEPKTVQTGTHKEIITVKGLVLNPDYEREQAERREAEFNKAFFKTSLGYIRRSVTMQDGSKKDFLSDLFPVISMGVQRGTAVNILAYNKPPFDEDVEDWTEYQKQVVATPIFVQECFKQLADDFLPINEEE